MSPASLREIVEYYTGFAEEDRLRTGSAQLEFERTRELLLRVLPRQARIVDVGGAAGAYAFWLSSLGHHVHLVDATPRLAREAAGRNATSADRVTITIGEARQLPVANSSADAILLLGPLYHLTESVDRTAALQEARRVLRPGGIVAAAGISRYAAILDGLVFHPALHARLAAMRQKSLIDGQYRNDSGDSRYFTTAYFHQPEGLAKELSDAGFEETRVLGIEGPGWLLADFDARWADAAGRADILGIAQSLESQPSIMGVSAHLLAIGVKSS